MVTLDDFLLLSCFVGKEIARREKITYDLPFQQVGLEHRSHRAESYDILLCAQIHRPYSRDDYNP